MQIRVFNSRRFDDSSPVDGNSLIERTGTPWRNSTILFDVDVSSIGKFDTPVCQLFWHVAPLYSLSRRRHTFTEDPFDLSFSRVTTMRVVQSEIEKKKEKQQKKRKKKREKERRGREFFFSLVVEENKKGRRKNRSKGAKIEEPTTDDSIFWLDRMYNGVPNFSTLLATICQRSLYISGTVDVRHNRTGRTRRRSRGANFLGASDVPGTGYRLYEPRRRKLWLFYCLARVLRPGRWSLLN